jgi:SAM-dependent methyltransferase
MPTAPTERFTGRAEAYRSGRPRYPLSLVTYLEAVGALRPGGVVADVGVGTGLSAEPFLERGHAVVGVEPNASMRAAGLATLGRFPAYSAREGQAEATGLPGASVDLVVAAQAFHWFDAAGFRAESRRILRPGGWGALVWNDRDVQRTPFLAGYEALMNAHGREYPALRRRHAALEAIAVYFGGQAAEPVALAHEGRLDWPGLLALASSASYLPAPGHDGHEALVADLRALFEAHATDGMVTMDYTCRVHAAPLT